MAEQLALFTEHSVRPEGLVYAGDFISGAFERELIAGVTSLPLQPFQFGQFEGKRRVASFGWRYDYSLRRLLPAEPVPAGLRPCSSKSNPSEVPARGSPRCYCTEYETGVGIGWHRDKPHFDRIFGISLASPCRFRMRKAAAGRWNASRSMLRPGRSMRWPDRPDSNGNTAFQRSRRLVSRSRCGL